MIASSRKSWKMSSASIGTLPTTRSYCQLTKNVRSKRYLRPFGASMTARFGYWRFAAGCRCVWKLPSDGTEHSRNKWPPAKQNTAKMFALLWTRAKGNDYYELRVRFAQASANRSEENTSERRDMLSKAMAQRIEFQSVDQFLSHFTRSEERRVGKECRSRW